MLEELRILLESRQDNALLRFSLGGAYHLKRKDLAKAVEHLAKAVELDPTYSAAWKLYLRSRRGNLEGTCRLE